MQCHPHIEISQPVDFPLDLTSFSKFEHPAEVPSRLSVRLLFCDYIIAKPHSIVNIFFNIIFNFCIFPDGPAVFSLLCLI